MLREGRQVTKKNRERISSPDFFYNLTLNLSVLNDASGAGVDVLDQRQQALPERFGACDSHAFLR